MTTFLFSNTEPEQASTIVRLLNFGEAPEGVVSMEASPAVNTSSLSLTFDHFNDTLVFDPGKCTCTSGPSVGERTDKAVLADFGLLMGSTARGGSDDNLGVIVGVAVAVPLAVAFVVVVIAVVMSVVMLKSRAARARSRGAVDFDAHDDVDDRL
jgi:hypothetical protein